MQRHSRNLIDLITEVVPHPLEGVEIGVFRGENARCILETFLDCKLVLVDLWKEGSVGEEYYDYHKRVARISQAAWDTAMAEALENISGFQTIVRRMSSRDAAQLQADGSLDFCFIDANHTYRAVKEDIGLWLPKIRKGGLISGHDYGGMFRGVQKAVDESFGQDNLMLRGAKIWGARV